MNRPLISMNGMNSQRLSAHVVCVCVWVRYFPQRGFCHLKLSQDEDSFPSPITTYLYSVYGSSTACSMYNLAVYRKFIVFASSVP
jgi:hypothetical protein